MVSPIIVSGIFPEQGFFTSAHLNIFWALTSSFWNVYQQLQPSPIPRPLPGHYQSPLTCCPVRKTKDVSEAVRNPNHGSCSNQVLPLPLGKAASLLLELAVVTLIQSTCDQPFTEAVSSCLRMWSPKLGNLSSSPCSGLCDWRFGQITESCSASICSSVKIITAPPHYNGTVHYN